MASTAGTILRHIHQLMVTQAVKNLSDAQLVQRFVAHHEETAFAALMQRHSGLVWSVCRRVLPQEHDAEDAFQATFLILARKADSIRKGDSVGNWLFGVAHRVAMKARLSASKRQQRESQSTSPSPQQPVSEAALHELQARLDAEVERLPVKYRVPFVLCCLEGKSRAEAAEELGWKIGTLSARLARGRQQLRQRLARRGVCLSAALTALALMESAARAAAPAGLTGTTLKGALLVVAGKPLAGVVSTQAAALARGILQTMFLTKLKIATAIVLFLSLVTGAGVFTHQVLADKQPQEKPAEEKKPPVEGPKQPKPDKNKPVRTDRYGDPMPPEALDRLGTMRLRHGAAVRSVAYAGNGKLLASAGGDWMVRLWDPVSGKEIRKVGNGTGPLVAVALSRDGKLIAGAVEQTTRPPLYLWSAATGKEVCALKQRGAPVAVAFSPDDKLLAAATREGAISLWDVKTGKEKQRLTGHQGGTLAIAFSPDGKTLVSGGQDLSLREWVVAGGKEQRVIRGHGGPVSAVAFSRDGTRLVSGSGDATARIWEVKTGRQLHQLQGHRGIVGSVAFSPNGKTLVSASGDRTLCLWDVATGRQLWQCNGAFAPVNSVAFAPNGKTVASGSGNYQVHLWDAGTGREIPRPGGHRGAVHGLAYSPDGKLLASGGHDYAICVWDMATRKERYRIMAHTSGVEALAFAPDGRTLASVSWDGALGLWETASGKKLGRIVGGAGAMHCVAYSPDGKMLAAGSSGGPILLWEEKTRREIRRLAGHTQMVRRVEFTPDGKLLASASLDKTVRVWAVETGKELYTLAGNSDIVNNAMALSADGRNLAARTEDGLLHVWELATGKERTRLPVKDKLVTLALSPDGKHLAGFVHSLAICVWDLSTGREVHRFTGHPVWCMTLAFSPDGRTLAAGSADSTVLLWDVGRVVGNKAQKTRELSAAGLQTEWKALMGDDAARAYRALWTLAAVPKQAVPLVQKHLQRAAPVDVKRIEQLVATLDDDDFAVRQKATTELAKLGTAAEAALRKVLRGDPSAEVRLRIENLLQKVSDGLPAADHWRKLRMLEVLERIGTPEARDLLKKAAAGKADPWLAREAQASRERLSRGLEPAR